MTTRSSIVLAALVLCAGLVGISGGQTFAQTCTPPPSGNVAIQVGGSTNTYGASGRTISATQGVFFSATIQTLGITGPLDIGITGLPPGVTQKANPLNPLGGATFSGAPTQTGSYSALITLENDCGTGSYAVPFVVNTPGGGTQPTPTTPTTPPPTTPTAPSGGSGSPATFVRTLIQTPFCSPAPCDWQNRPILNAGRVKYNGANHFVVTGAVGGGGTKGLYAFTGEGQAAGIGNLWADVLPGLTINANVHHIPSTGLLQFNGSSGFVASTANGQFGGLPLSYYEFSGGQLAYRSKSSVWTGPEIGRSASLDFAVANGHAVALHYANSNNPTELVTYRLPAFTEVRAVSSTLLPSLGVGEFIVAASGNSTSASVDVYRVENDGNLAFVQNLPDLNFFSRRLYDIDHSSSPLQVSFADASSNQPTSIGIVTYRVTANGFERIGRETFQAPPGFRFYTATAGTFAVNGNTRAFSMCSGQGTSRTCGVGLYDGTTYLGLVPAPSFPTTDPTVNGEYGSDFFVSGVDIAPSGSMIIVNWYGAQLYRVGGAGGGGAPTAPSLPGGGGTVDLSTYYDFARQYLEILKAFFNAR